MVHIFNRRQSLARLHLQRILPHRLSFARSCTAQRVGEQAGQDRHCDCEAEHCFCDAEAVEASPVLEELQLKVIMVFGEGIELPEEVGLDRRAYADRHVAAYSQHQRPDQRGPPFLGMITRLCAGVEGEEGAGGELEHSSYRVEGGERIEEAGVCSDLDGIVGPIGGEAVLRLEVLRSLAD